MQRTATCACGHLTAVCIGEPIKVSLCHCLACQKRTGSTYGIAAFYRRSDVTPCGDISRRYTRAADSGFAVTFHFCPDCGSSVYWEPQRLPDLIAVAAGAFADPAFPAPTQALNEASRHRWVLV